MLLVKANFGSGENNDSLQHKISFMCSRWHRLPRNWRSVPAPTTDIEYRSGLPSLDRSLSLKAVCLTELFFCGVLRMNCQWRRGRGSLAWKWPVFWWNATNTRSDWWNCRRRSDGLRWFVPPENIRISCPDLIQRRRSPASGTCKSFLFSYDLLIYMC